MTRREMMAALPALITAPRWLAQVNNAPIRTKGINHVTLKVSDVKRSVDFYQGLFGMPVMNREGNAVASLQIGSGPQHLGISAAGSDMPKIDHICLGVPDFNLEHIVGVLTQRGFTKSDEVGPMKVRLNRPKDAAPQLLFYDADTIAIQLQDPRYCGGSGPLGNMCRTPEASPKKGLMALKGWSHCTIFGSDAARSNKFYQDLFGWKIQGYQAPAGSTTSPFLSAGNGVEFLMFGGGGGGGRGGVNAAPRAGSINHLCMSMDNFNPDAVIKNLESYGIKPRGNAQGTPGPLVHYISLRMENRGGSKEGTPELYFTDPDGLLIQLQDTKYCGGSGALGEVCPS